MDNYHGILIDVSQKNKTILDKLKILNQKEDRDWILYLIEVKKDKLNGIIKELQENIVDGFYFHFYRDSELIVVFKNKIFKTKTDKSTWEEIIKYGKAQGIPKEQLDFYPCRIEDEIN